MRFGYIVFGTNVETVHSNAIRFCDKLTSIYVYSEPYIQPMGGYEECWDAVTIYTYSETAPTAEGNYWHYDANGRPVVWGAESDENAEGSVGLAYTLSSDGTYYTVTGIGECTDTDVVIPSTYNDLPVRAIGDNAFAYCSSLTSVDIPMTSVM